jgi:hypothetical protein
MLKKNNNKKQKKQLDHHLYTVTFMFPYSNSVSLVPKTACTTSSLFNVNTLSLFPQTVQLAGLWFTINRNGIESSVYKEDG